MTAAILLAAVVCWLILRNLNRQPQDEFVAPTRHQVALQVTVIDHAVEQGQTRYPDAAVTAELVAADVAHAIDHGRVGERLMVKGQSLRGAKDNAKLAWTARCERVYVIRPDGANRVLVITALPAVETSPESGDTAIARALRRAMVA